MKKTIAILLVLVLAGVGLFAYNATSPIELGNTLTIKATIPPFNFMKLSNYQVAPPAEEEWEGYSAYTDTRTSPTIDSSEPTGVASLHTISNSYNGFTVTMTAGALTALGQTGSGLTTGIGIIHLPYTIKAFTVNGGWVETANGEGEAKTIIDTSASAYNPAGPVTARAQVSRDLVVEIPTLETGINGNYQGNVTFAFTAI